MMDFRLGRSGWTKNRVARACVALYLIAGVAGIVNGPKLDALMQMALPGDAVPLAGAVVVVVLSGALLVDRVQRTATLMLATLLFLSSYLALSTDAMSGGVAGGLPAFWRDVTLILILLATLAGLSSKDVGDAADARRAGASVEPVFPLSDPSRPKRLSRGSVQRAYEVNPAGRAVSRQIKPATADKPVDPIIVSG